MRADTPNVLRRSVVLEGPGARAEDGVAVEVEPAADLPQALLEDGHNAAVGSGAHVEQQVAAERDRLHECAHELRAGEHVRERQCAPVAPRVAVERQARLPLVQRQRAGREAVAARVEVAVRTEREEAPPVVRHHCIANGALLQTCGNCKEIESEVSHSLFAVTYQTF